MTIYYGLWSTINHYYWLGRPCPSYVAARWKALCPLLSWRIILRQLSKWKMEGYPRYEAAFSLGRGGVERGRFRRTKLQKMFGTPTKDWHENFINYRLQSRKTALHESAQVEHQVQKVGTRWAVSHSGAAAPPVEKHRFFVENEAWDLSSCLALILFGGGFIWRDVRFVA